MARYLSSETQPYGKWKGIPIYLTTILAAVFVLGLIVSTVLRAADSELQDSLVMSIPLVSWSGLIGMVTYPFMGLPNFFTPFAIMCFYWWGKGIESHLGRQVLGRLLALLILLPVAVGWVVWFTMGYPTAMQGNYVLTVGLIVAFATLYPNAEVWGYVPFKYFAAFCVACAILIPIGDKAWMAVLSTVLLCGGSYLYIRQAIEAEHDDYIPLGKRIRAFFGPRRKFRVVPREQHTTYRERERTERSDDSSDMEAEMDTLLEKIAKSGLDSLTPAERKRLEKAREALMKKERQ